MPKDLTPDETETLTNPIAVPVDADPRNAASVETPFQQLWNRIAALAERLGGLENAGEWLYRNASGTPITKARNIHLAPYAAKIVAGSPSIGPSTLGSVTLSPGDHIAWVIDYLPTGATGITAQFQGTFDGSSSITVRVRRSGLSTAQDSESGTSNFNVFATSGAAIDRSAASGVVVVELEVPGGALNDVLVNSMLQLSFDDPAPRNF